MGLKELRSQSQNSQEQPKKGLAALRTKPVKDTSRQKEAEGGQWKQEQEPDALRTMFLMKEFDKLPWYGKMGQAADDLVRSAASGVTYGGIDKLLGPEAKELTKDAQLRAGVPGTVAEIGGMLASPVTRAVSAGAQVLRPAGSGLWKALTNLGVTAGEGATLAGIDAVINNPENIAENAATGAGLAAGTEATLKHAFPKTAGLLANLLSKVPYKDLADIYEISSKSSLGAKAVKDLQQNKAPVALIDAIDKTRTKLEGVPVPKTDEIEEALVNVFGRTTTSSGHKALDAQDQTIVNRLFDKAYTSKIDATTFNRNNLDDLAGYLEETKVPPAAEKSAGGMHVKNVHDTIKKVGSESSPEFKKLMDYFDIRKKAYTAGKATSTLSPNTRAFDTARDVGLATAFIAGSAALTNPVLLTALIPMLTAASPRAVGTIARKAGSTKRNLKKVMPKGTGYGSMGLVPGLED
jgi:hypothetical protein